MHERTEPGRWWVVNDVAGWRRRQFAVREDGTETGRERGDDSGRVGRPQWSELTVFGTVPRGRPFLIFSRCCVQSPSELPGYHARGGKTRTTPSRGSRDRDRFSGTRVSSPRSDSDDPSAQTRLHFIQQQVQGQPDLRRRAKVTGILQPSWLDRAVVDVNVRNGERSGNAHGSVQRTRHLSEGQLGCHRGLEIKKRRI